MRTSEGDVPDDKDVRDGNPVFGRYVSVWMWSLLLGIAILIGLSFTYYRNERWGVFGLTLGLLQLLGGICILLSLSKLLRFLATFLLPAFFGEAEIAPEEHVHAGKLLEMSFRYTLCAMAFRVLLASIEFVFTLNSHGRVWL